MSKPRKRRIKPFISLLLLLFVCCGLFATYLTVFRRLDEKLCLNRMAERIGVEPSYANIGMFIENKLEPGMQRDEVESILKRLGPISTRQVSDITVKVTVRQCWHPMNHIIINTRYTDKDILISKRIEDPDAP
jgi:hypothetical protein